MKTQRKTWQNIFLPRDEPRRWTWQMLFLLGVAAFLLVDSWYVPSSQNIDPGQGGEVMLSMILAFRAVSHRGLSTPIMLLGTLLAGLTILTDHGLIGFRTNGLSVLVDAVLLVVVVLCGSKPGRAEPPKSAKPDPESVLHLSAKR